jgi:hypothetical protein
LFSITTVINKYLDIYLNLIYTLNSKLKCAVPGADSGELGGRHETLIHEIVERTNDEYNSIG